MKRITFLLVCTVFFTGCIAQAPEGEQATCEPFIGTYIKEYDQKIEDVQKRIPIVIGDREVEVEVLHRLLGGYSMHAIGKHMRLSSTTIFRGRNSVVVQMLNSY